MRRAYRALYRGEELVGAVRARGHHVENFRRRAVLLRATRPVAGGGGGPRRQRFRQGRAAAAADGIRSRGAEADFDQPRGERRLMVEPQNFVLEHLRAVRGDIGKLASEMQALGAEITSIRQRLADHLEKLRA